MNITEMKNWSSFLSTEILVAILQLKLLSDGMIIIS